MPITDEQNTALLERMLWLRGRLERHFSSILRLRGRLEQHFSGILGLRARLEQHFSGILRLRAISSGHFRAFCGSRAGASGHFEPAAAPGQVLATVAVFRAVKLSSEALQHPSAVGLLRKFNIRYIYIYIIYIYR